MHVCMHLFRSFKLQACVTTCLTASIFVHQASCLSACLVPCFTACSISVWGLRLILQVHLNALVCILRHTEMVWMCYVDNKLWMKWYCWVIYIVSPSTPLWKVEDDHQLFTTSISKQSFNACIAFLTVYSGKKMVFVFYNLECSISLSDVRPSQTTSICKLDGRESFVSLTWREERELELELEFNGPLKW